MEKYLISLIKNNSIKCFNLALHVIFVLQISFMWKILSWNSSTLSSNIFASFPVCNPELCIKLWRRSLFDFASFPKAFIVSCVHYLAHDACFSMFQLSIQKNNAYIQVFQLRKRCILSPNVKKVIPPCYFLE